MDPADAIGQGTSINMSQTPANPARSLILVCDDEAHIRRIVAAKLRETGYEVLEARDGVQGLEIARRERPILVITDLQMPGGTGLEMAQQLRLHPETGAIPLLMLTARGYILTPEELAQTNIREVVAKPFGVRQLIERVRAVLSPGAPGERIAA
jgi:DNA-binding response OmpR family regulator